MHNPGELVFLIHIDAGRGSADDALVAPEGIADLDARIGDQVLADPFVVPGSPHFEDVEGAGHFSADLHVLQQDDRVGDGGDVGFGDGMGSHELVGGVGEKAGDLLLLGQAGYPDYKLAEGILAHSPRQG